MDLSNLPAGVLWEIARRLLPSRRSIDAMRAVCREWRRHIPSTRGPWLVLAPTDPGGVAVTGFFTISAAGDGAEANAAGANAAAAAGAGFSPFFPMFPPPQDGRCWSCAMGLMALRYVEEDRTTLFCVNCGSELTIGYLPAGSSLASSALFPGVHCAISSPPEIVLLWNDFDLLTWNQMHLPDDLSPRSLDSIADVYYIAASPRSVVIDRNFIERMRPLVAAELAPEVLEVLEPLMVDGVLPVAPPIIREMPLDEPHSIIWSQRGEHVFRVGRDMFACILVRDDMNHTLGLRLFSVVQIGEEDYHILRTTSIGNQSLFLGFNQAFALPAVTTRANTAYVVDHDGFRPAPQVIAIDINTQEQWFLPYPPAFQHVDVVAAWLSPLQNEEENVFHF